MAATMEEDLATTAANEMQDVLGLARERLAQRPGDDKTRRDSRWDLANSRHKWPKVQAQKGSTGKGHAAWDHWRPHQDEWFQTESLETEVNRPTQVLLSALVRLAIRHEAELAKIRIDATFMFYFDTGSVGILPQVRQVALQWHRQFEEGKVKSPLGTILLLSMPSSKPSIKNDEILGHVTSLQKRIAEPGVLTLFKDVEHRSLRQRSLAVYLHPQLKKHSGLPVPCIDSCPGEQLGIEAHRSPHQAGQGRAPASSGSAGEGLPRCPLDGMAGTQAGVESGWQGEPRGHEGGAGHEGRVSSREPGRASVLPTLPLHSVFAVMLFLLCLQRGCANPHNVCYLNAVAQAMSWLGQMATVITHCCGRARAALNIPMRSGQTYLPECLPWRDVLSNWRFLDRQHDASVFLAHLFSLRCVRCIPG